MCLQAKTYKVTGSLSTDIKPDFICLLLRNHDLNPSLFSSGVYDRGWLDQDVHVSDHDCVTESLQNFFLINDRYHLIAKLSLADTFIVLKCGVKTFFFSRQISDGRSTGFKII